MSIKSKVCSLPAKDATVSLFLAVKSEVSVFLFHLAFCILLISYDFTTASKCVTLLICLYI